MAACLAAAPFAAASHRSVAQLCALPGVAPPPLPEITVFGDLAPRLQGVIVHRSDFLHEDDRSVLHDIPVTSVARTIIDLGRYLSTTMQARVLNDAERRRLCTLDDVRACLERIGGRGRPGTAWMRILLEERQLGWHPGDSDFEVRTVRRFKNAGLRGLVQQHQVVVGRHVYVLDVAWPAVKVGVDVNGPVHLTQEAQKHDADRRNRLKRAGWDMYEVTPGTDLAEVIAAVQVAIARRQAALNRDLDG